MQKIEAPSACSVKRHTGGMSSDQMKLSQSRLVKPIRLIWGWLICCGRLVKSQSFWVPVANKTGSKRNQAWKLYINCFCIFIQK